MVDITCLKKIKWTNSSRSNQWQSLIFAHGMAQENSLTDALDTAYGLAIVLLENYVRCTNA